MKAYRLQEKQQNTVQYYTKFNVWTFTQRLAGKLSSYVGRHTHLPFERRDKLVEDILWKSEISGTRIYDTLISVIIYAVQS